MSMNTIKINEEVSLSQGVTPEEGLPIYDKIIKLLKEGKHITLDFENMELVTTAFLNVIIGKLYEKYTSEQLKKMLSFEHLTDGIAMRIKAVSDTAKEYYKNKDQFNQDVDSILYGHN